MPERTPVGTREQLPDRVTMPLLARISQQSLDEDYVHAAQSRRRRAGAAGPVDPAGPGDPVGPDDPAGPAGSSRTRALSPVTVAVVAVFGLMIAVAAVQTSRNAEIQDAGRSGLISRIEQQRAVVAAQQERVADLRQRNTAAEASLTDLTQQEGAETTRLRRLQTTTGFIAVSGEGLRVTLDSRPGADDTQKVRDTDLALLANALWSAGAEAVAINGQRLTARSAIRTSGPAVEVNGIGIAPPFTILAIGDRDTLEARLYDTSSGLAFADLQSYLGFVVDMQDVAEMSLPAAPTRLERLRSATPATGSPTENRTTDEEMAP